MQADPLAAWDALIEALEAEGAAVRRAAATLLALQGELRRAAQRAEARAQQLSARAQEAARRGEAGAAALLAQDAARAQAAADEAALARVEEDAQLLVASATGLQERLSALRAERESARVRLRAGALVREVLQRESEHFGRRVALQAARDEVERAHALAELYREEQRRR